MMKHMLIGLIQYIKPLSEIELFLEKHRMHLKEFLEKGHLVFSGRMHPRTGGVILAKNISRKDFESFLKEDPFFKNQVSKFTLVEFIPGLMDPELSAYLEKEPQ